MEEGKVTEIVRIRLEHEGYLVVEQFEAGDSKMDLAAFKWLSDYDMDCLAIECKGDLKPQGAYQILIDQVSRYQKHFPKVFLAISRPGKSENLDAIKSLCTIQGAGLFCADSDQATIEKEPPEINPKFDEEIHLRTRARAAMLLAFVEVFGKDINLKARWCSTKGSLQFNASVDNLTSSMMFGINAEDARRINLEQVNKEKLLVGGKGIKSPIFTIVHERYRGRGFRVREFNIRKRLDEVTEQDIEHLKRLCKESPHNIHLGIGDRLWSFDEVLSKSEYYERVRKAREALEGLHRLLSP